MPSASQVAITAGMAPSKQGRMSSSVIALRMRSSSGGAHRGRRPGPRGLVEGGRRHEAHRDQPRRVVAEHGADGVLRVADRELARDYVDRMVTEISSIGYPQDTIRMMFSHDPARLVAVSFAPTASFDQTPGARPAAPVSPT